MNILMMSNTYTPIVGGIERSIEAFSSGYRKEGNKVLIVAPVFQDMPDEKGVYRIPAIQKFNGTDFSVELPVPGILKGILDEFKPDIVHSHHPFLVGDTALRVSAGRDIPIVFTYHTMYELNTHYVPGDSETLKKFVVNLATGYSNLCDRVVVPSESIERILKRRGVATETTVIPTGLNASEFAGGDGASFRKRFGIPERSFLAGYLGRIAEEKNIEFLIEAVAAFLKHRQEAHMLIAGDGSLMDESRARMAEEGLGDRTHFTGILKGQDKADAYHAMDVFVFASRSETQGIVLLEAMCSGAPVVGLDAPGVREVVRDGKNGYLVREEDKNLFTKAMDKIFKMDASAKEQFEKEARAVASEFDEAKSIRRMLGLYQQAIDSRHEHKDTGDSVWDSSKRSIRKEVEILSNIVRSAGEALDLGG